MRGILQHLEPCFQRYNTVAEGVRVRREASAWDDALCECGFHKLITGLPTTHDLYDWL